MENFITAESRLTSKQFVQFARFNTYQRGKRLIGPFIFMAIMLVFALICYTHKDGMLLTVVLATLGVGLPLVYVIQYELSLRKQCKLMKLDGQKVAYTLRFSDRGISVKANDGKKEFHWDEMNDAYRNGDCIYLYTNKGNAYLIPENDSFDEIWDLICKRIQKTKIIGGHNR